MMYVPVRDDEILTFVVAEPSNASVIAAASGWPALDPAGLAAFFIRDAFLYLGDDVADHKTGAGLRAYLNVDADNAFWGDFGGTWDYAMALLKKTPGDLEAFNTAFDEIIDADATDPLTVVRLGPEREKSLGTCNLDGMLAAVKRHAKGLRGIEFNECAALFECEAHGSEYAVRFERQNGLAFGVQHVAAIRRTADALGLIADDDR